MQRIQTDWQRDKAEKRDVVELLNGDTELSASPEGLIEIPRWRACDYKDGKVKLKDMLYKDKSEVGALMAMYDMTAHDRGEDPTVQPNVEGERLELPPPEGALTITDPESMANPSGWLSPDGKFYSCGWMQHISLMDRLEMDPIEAEKLGWLKLDSRYGPLPEVRMTQRQVDMLFDWYTEHSKELPHSLEDWLKGDSNG